MATVEYDGIGKNFGPVTVMENISFAIDAQKFVVLLGPSGCGKTTLLRMTAGLETISAGEIRMGGKRMNEIHPRDRDIAMVFQTYALYPQMTVFDNIAFSLQVRKIAAEEIKRQVEEAAEILDLTDYLKRYPRALSGGQRQRVAMGRALVRHPQVFLFDEPLSNLDAKLRGQMRLEIRRIHDRLNTTTIYVTHDQIEAMTMADEIVVMNGGNIEQIGSPEEIYDRPANCFVADFIGSPSINLLKGVVENQDGKPAMRIGDNSLRLPDSTSAAAGQSIVYGIRPLDIEVGIDGEASGTVEFVENTGAETHLHIRFDGHDIRAVAPGRLRVNHGDRLNFTINPDKVHVFDQSSEMRVD
ncbi:ABC transporter ATP-binding protein [Pelagibius sp. Alg239-R121]|uniref:ABC transporter ATP-binding protein n=1 Tax=Pelagibius sp. Alg239-R121 TaxID=2993448 RepID=UPI0024A711E7|nr:sn-glycerol-3-phosphate ABC transporter ATP-binding protein UgpC [Pelagibius sp. Alg239-R121]